jgi:hypothetical protein
MDVEKGIFQAIKPPNIYGNGRYLTKDTNYIISYDASIGDNKTIPLPGIMNKRMQVGDYDIPEMPANINYRLIENTLGIQFYKIAKDYNDYYLGWGIGMQNQPYGFVMLGRNGKFFEIGGAALGGLTLNEASYEGGWYYHVSYFRSHNAMFAKTLAEQGISDDYDKLEYVKLKDVKILHLYGGITTYASLYLEKFALNYAASVTNPWIVNELLASKGDGSHGADISFFFPVLLMQDIGISYMPHKIKYRFGINQITGVKFPGQYWGLSVQMAYGW